MGSLMKLDEHDVTRAIRPGLAPRTTRVIGMAGWSGSGKTTLITRLIPVLKARGLSVSTLKHAHHGFDIDRPGKDSHQHREAGAHEVMIASARRWALLHEMRDAPEWPLSVLLGALAPVDLVIIEGFKAAPYPKIEVHRAETGKPFLHPDDPHIVAIVSNDLGAALGLPVFPPDAIERIADFVLGAARDLPSVIETLRSDEAQQR